MEDEIMYKNLPTEADIELQANAPCSWPYILFRVAAVERSMFWRMSIMFMLIAFIYSIMRDLKDVVILDKQEATSINVIKSAFVTPFSFFFVFMIQKLLSKHTVSRILKIMVLAFGVYFVFYSTVLLVFKNLIEPDPIWSDMLFADGKMAFRGLQSGLAVAKAINFWTGSLLYISAELWGNIILSLLFLNFSNEVCTPKQSTRFIPLFFIGSNVGLFLSGLTLLGFSYMYETLAYTWNKFIMNGIIFIMGLVCLGIFLIHRNLENSILSKPFFIPERGIKRKKKKQAVGFIDGILYMAKSLLLLNICFIVIAYNVTTNLIDSTFKATMKAKAAHLNQNVGNSVMKTQAYNQILVSLFVIFFLCTPFGRLVQIAGWAVTGYITPIFAMIGGSLFFMLAVFNTGCEKKNMWVFVQDMFKGGEPGYAFEEFVGRIAASFMKVFKYSAFDIAKEAISVRINAEDRPRFKGIYDGVCGKLGKAGGSMLTLAFSGIGNVTDIRCAAQLSLITNVSLCLVFLVSVRYLGRKYNQSLESNTDIDLDMIGKGKKKNVEVE